VHAVGAGEEREIRPVVGEEQRALRTAERRERSQELERLARGGVLGAELEQGRSDRENAFGERDRSEARALESSEVDDGVESAHGGILAPLRVVEGGMLGKRLLDWTACSLLIAGCGGGSAQVRASASTETRSASGDAEARADGATARHPGTGEQKAPGDASERAAAAPAPSGYGEPSAPEAPPAPAHDPNLVRQALDLSAAGPGDGRARLGLRLAVVEQGPDRPWLVAVVNRGTAPARVVFDLRTLSLEVTPKLPEPLASQKKRAQPKPPKPIVCALPRDVVPKSEQRDLETELLPGEALVDSFDPRLYCMPQKGVSPLTPGATVVARLGWSEATRKVWRKGKADRVVLEQRAPFIARAPGDVPAMPSPGAQPAPRRREPAVPPEGSAPDSDRFGVKILEAPSLSLGDAYDEPPAESEPESERRAPLALLASGSDASTERDATVTVTLLNRSDEAYDVHFRREFVSFELSGPSGFVSCEPGPDDRAPDRALFSRLVPGRRLAAKSRLIELCPPGALRAPGLYLVHARFDAAPGGSSAQKPFWGRVVSRKPATVRVRKGWGELSAQHAPLRVRVGSAAPE